MIQFFCKSCLYFCFFLLVFLFPLPTAAQNSTPPSSTAKTVILTAEQGEYPLGLSLEILEDRSGQLTIEQVALPEYDRQFTPSQAEVPNFGFTGSVVWVRLRLKDEAGSNTPWWLEVGFANIHYVDLYAPLPDGSGFSHKQSGIMRPFAARDVPHHQPIFVLSLPPHKEQIFYLRFQSEASLTLPLTLWSQAAFMQKDHREQLAAGLFYGVLLAMLGYNLFLFLSLRDRSYLFYLLFISGFLLFHVAITGRANQYFGPDWVAWSYFLVPLFTFITFFGLVTFTGTFLVTRSHAPQIHRVLLGLGAVCLLLILLSPLVRYRFLAMPSAVLAIITCLAAFIASLVTWRQGYRPARYFVMAALIFLMAIISFALVRLGFLASTPLTEDGPFLGMIWLVVLFSLALADRINLLKAEAEQSNRALRESESRLSQYLEAMPVGVTVHELGGKLAYVNEQARRLLNFPASFDLAEFPPIEVARAKFPIYITNTEQLYPLENYPLIRALQGEVARADDLEFRSGNQAIQLEVWSRPIFNAQGQIHYAISVFQDITGRKQLEDRLTAVYLLGQELTRLRDEAAIIRRVLDTALSTLHAGTSGYGIVDEESDELVYSIYVAGDVAAPHQMRFSLAGERGLGVVVIRSGQPLNIPDTHREPRYVSGPGDWVAHSALYAPLKIGAEVMGVLSVESAELNHFTPADQLLFQTLAGQAAVGIENARLFQQVQRYTETLEQLVAERAAELLTTNQHLHQEIAERRRVEEALRRHSDYLEALHPIALELFNRHEVDEVLQTIVDQAAALLDAPYSEIALAEGDELVVRAYTKNQSFLASDRIRRDEGLVSWLVYDSKQPVILDNYGEWPSHRTIYDSLRLHAAADLPILAGQKCLGVLCMGRDQPGYPFDQEQVQVGLWFAQLAALALDNAQLYTAAQQELAERKRIETVLRQAHSELAQRLDELATLNTIAQTVATLTDLRPALERVAEQVTHLFQAYSTVISLLDKDRTERIFVAVYRSQNRPGPDLQGWVIPLAGDRAYNEYLGQGKSLIISDPKTSPYSETFHPAIREQDLKCLMLIPLQSRGEVIGAITLTSDQPGRQFTLPEVKLAETVAAQIAAALENARLFEQEQRQRQLAESLREVAVVLNSSLEWDVVIAKILEELRSLISYDSAALFWRVADHLVLIRGADVDEKFMGHRILLTSENPTTLPFKLKEPVILKDVGGHPHWKDDIEEDAATYLIKSWMGAPLVSAGDTLGVLTTDSYRPGAYTQADANILQIFASQAAIAMQNARLYQQVQQELKERQRAEEELKKYAAELEAFAHTVAHDLKSPLGIVSGFAEILADYSAELTVAQQLEYMQSIQRTSRKMVNIVDELLLLARLRREDVALRPVNMNKVVKSALARLSMMIDEYQGQIILPDRWPFALGYAAWIEEIWVNYVSNGLKYGGQPPVLELGATRQADGLVCFWVKDNGSGLTPEAQQRLFTELTRLDEVRAQGHGLGLSIVRRIIEKLGGEVRVESEGVPGKGSIFSFTLPGISVD